MDFPGRLISGFLAVILIFIFPLQYIAQLNSENIDALVDGRTHKFTDTIRDKGYLDKEMYEDYLNYLDSTGQRYEVELQDIHPVRGEEYSLYQDNNSNGFLRVSHNVSHNEIKTFSTHTHTENCYAGDLHICNDIDCEYDNNIKKILIAVGAYSTSSGTNRNMYYSYDGVKWNSYPNNSSSGYNVKSIDYMNGQFIMRGFFGYISTSEDGMNWNMVTDLNVSLPPDISLNQPLVNSIIDIVYIGNGYYISTVNATRKIGYNSKTVGLFLRSTDLKNWECIAEVNKRLGDMAISNIGTKKILVAIALGKAGEEYPGYYTMDILDDGSLQNITLNPRYTNTYETLSIQKVGDYAVITSNESYGYIVPGVYTGYHHNIGQNSLFKYGNGIYLAFGRSHSGYMHSLYRGTSINNLVQVTNHNINLYNTGIAIAHFGDRFIVSGREQTGPESYSYYTYSSTDGITWTKQYAPKDIILIVSNTEDRGPCLKKGKYYDSTGKEVSPICDKVVVSISATNPNQTVDKGKPIITTATATYLDGHKAIVNCSSNYNPNLVGKQTVTLTYTGLVGNAKTTGTRNCKVEVTVKPVNVLTSITVLPISQTIKRYDSPTFTVKANYNDGTSKILNEAEYSIRGFNASIIGSHNVTISYTENDITKATTVMVTVTPLQRECPRCNQLYNLNSDDTDPGCPHCKEIITGIEVTPDYVEIRQGESLPITVVAIYNDGSRETIDAWTSNFDSERVGLQIVTVEYGGHAKEITVWVNDKLIPCPICGTEYPEAESNCPICAEKVVSISASPKEITVMQYEPIILSVIAVYADGSSREVEGWSIDKDSIVPGTFLATVSYKGVSDAITLTVLSINTIECPICGTKYDISVNLKGCPICSEELIGIEAYLTSGSNLVQLGTTPTIAVILIFRDEHREFAYEGFTLENFNPNELGIQTVKVIYKEFFTSLVLEVVNILDVITCPNGHVYHKNFDGTDPGCPFCNTEEDISKILYFDITYTSEILEEVYSIGRYDFQEGNYISVIIIKKDKSLLYRLQRMFFGTSLLGRKKRFTFGGEIY